MRIYKRNNKKRKFQYVVQNLIDNELEIYYGDIPWYEHDWDKGLRTYCMLLHEVRLRA